VEHEDDGVKKRERIKRVGKKVEYGKREDDIWGEGGVSEGEDEENDGEEEEFQEDD
jgi:hypothetical protein